LLVDELRGGEPQPKTAKDLATAVTNWLFSGAVKLYIEQQLAVGTPVRVVLQTYPTLLDGTLADVPFELVDLENDPLVLKKGVQGLVHALRKVGPVTRPATSQSWPLRVLIVRSNPEDLGDQVPPAASIR